MAPWAVRRAHDAVLEFHRPPSGLPIGLHRLVVSAADHAAGLLEAPEDTTPAALLAGFDWARVEPRDQVMRWSSGALSRVGPGPPADGRRGVDGD